MTRVLMAMTLPSAVTALLAPKNWVRVSGGARRARSACARV
jgi:hypothetical protein